MMQPARHAVPEAPQVLGVAAADVLPAAQILRRAELLVKVVVAEPQEHAVVIDRGLGDHARLVDVVVLERVVRDAVDHRVAVVVAARAAGAALARLRS